MRIRWDLGGRLLLRQVSLDDLVEAIEVDPLAPNRVVSSLYEELRPELFELGDRGVELIAIGGIDETGRAEQA
jgi:hypothetical protein